MKIRLGEEYPNFLDAHHKKPVVSVRLNPAKFPDVFPDSQPVPWCKTAHYLNERPEFVFDPVIHAGGYYVQEASSMLFANLIDFSKPLKILDLCAAPGGKSSLILQNMNKESLLFSNEMVYKRAEILRENLVKWGNPNVVVSSSRVTDFSKFNSFFDIILIDAPCSGEGMFRKSVKAIDEWNENKSAQCSVIQKQLLENAIPLLRKGGLLIYSTCTYSPLENEDVMSWFYKTYSRHLSPMNFEFPAEWGVKIETIAHFNGTEQDFCICLPHKIKGEGMFIGAFQIREQAGKPFKEHKTQNLFKSLSTEQEKEARKFIQIEKPYVLKIRNEEVFILHEKYLKELNFSANTLFLLKSGIKAGVLNRKNGEFIPSHELAMSPFVHTQMQSVELSKENSLQYLKKEDFSINPEIQNGWVLAKYHGFNLGWLKFSGKRFNNFYPSEWKIRKDISAFLAETE